MKKHLLLLLAGLMMTASLSAQTFTVLHRFLPDGVDGAQPSGALSLSQGMLYGATLVGGTNNSGVIYKLDTAGTNYQTIYTFTGGGSSVVLGPLTIDGNRIYSTAFYGGEWWGIGSVFGLNTDGSNYSPLHYFNGENGRYPNGGLFLQNGVLTGTCSGGGFVFWGGGGAYYNQYLEGAGVFFSISTNATLDDQSSFQIKGQFNTTNQIFNPVMIPFFEPTLISSTNGGSLMLQAGVSLDSGGLPRKLSDLALTQGDYIFTRIAAHLNWTDLWTGEYNGITNSPYGSVYGPAGGGTYTHWHHFTGGTDGAYPSGAVLADGFYEGNYSLYGVTAGEGNVTAGTIYRYDRPSGNFTTLHTFSPSMPSLGSTPVGKLVKIGNILYGVTKTGGDYDYGTIYKINTDGTGFTVLHSFQPSTDGGWPLAGLTVETARFGLPVSNQAAQGTLLYGTTTAYGIPNDGNVTGKGTVFALDITPPPPPKAPDLTLGTVYVPGIQVFAFTNSMDTINPVHYFTNHISLPGQAVYWTPTNAFSSTLLTSSNLAAPLNFWVPIATDWTNFGQTQIGKIINPKPNDPPAFFILKSVAN